MNTIRMWGRAGVMAATLGFAAHAHANDGVVGPGNCNDSGLNDVLANVDGSGGGTITFDCGTATITFAHYKEIGSATTIDGGGRITFDGGNASPFFQMFGSANVTLKNLTFLHGVNGDVHAIENFGTLTLDHVVVAANASTQTPVMNFGTAVVVASTFSGNSASDATDGKGGAIANEGDSLSVTSSTFVGNSAVFGAAIYSESDLTVTNSTFSGNNGSNGGGSIYQVSGGTAVLQFLTIVGNSAPFGAGLYNDGNATMIVGGSIDANNSTGNCDGVISSSGYNLSDDGGCGATFTGPGDVINTPLPMQALGNNGGPTQTRLPQAGNPAIDHVPVSACSPLVDQRGAARPFGSACDSGAVEVGSAVNDVIFADGFDGT
jgi:predicted outer membrane repeat protein